MKVSELRELLDTAPDDAEVLLSSDPEGNDYHQLIKGDAKAKAVLDDGEGFSFWYVVHPDDQSDYEDGGLSPVVVLWP